MSDGKRQAKAKVRVHRWVKLGRLREIREDSGLSQGELARALGVSQSSVSRWEAREAYPRARRAADIVELLGGD